MSAQSRFKAQLKTPVQDVMQRAMSKPASLRDVDKIMQCTLY